MGEIADDMIEGRACQMCGCYFVDPADESEIYEHGFPVTCAACWSGLSEKEKKGHQKASAPTL